MNIQDITLKEVKVDKEYHDYAIYVGSTQVGIFLTVEDETKLYNFGREITVYEPYQGQGIGTAIINSFLLSHAKPFRFCIATNSCKALDFWQFYLQKTSFPWIHLRGEIYEITA